LDFVVITLATHGMKRRTSVRLERHGFDVVRAFDLGIRDVPEKLQECSTTSKSSPVSTKRPSPTAFRIAAPSAGLKRAS